MPTSDDQDQDQNENEFPFGSIVSIKSHPYPPSEMEAKVVKIAAFNHFTPPLMTVVEIQRSKFDPKTGKRKVSYKCLFYSTKSGAFEDNWFKEHELKFIGEPDRKCYEDNKASDLLTLKENLIGKQVIMTTVDLELQKRNVYKDHNPELNRYRQKPLLDFLPPLGTVISVDRIQTYIKYDQNTGEKDFEKSRINVKVRWYNNKSGRFSEQDVPLVSLKSVEVGYIKDKEYDEKEIYLLTKTIKLEDNDTVEIKTIPLKFQDIIFNHYYYQYRFKNLFTKGIELIKSDDLKPGTICSATEKFSGSGDQKELVYLQSIINQPMQHSEIRSKDIEEEQEKWMNKWIRIEYVDHKYQYTTRIIYTRTIKDSDWSDNPGIKILEANCLLRDGDIRNFRTDRILKVEELKESFINTFVTTKD